MQQPTSLTDSCPIVTTKRAYRQRARRRSSGACTPHNDCSAVAFRRWRPVVNATESSDSNLPLSDLKDRLEFAIRAEDYKAAASIRDQLKQRSSDARAAVEEANNRFYAAFEAGDMRAMGEVWGEGEHVQVMHPATHCIAGRQGVLESWQLLTRGARKIRITLEDVRIYAGDGDAFVTCVEVIDAAEERGRTAATNIFEKQNGRWVIVHHHGGPIPPPIRV